MMWLQGSRPVMSSYRMTPKLYTSTFSLCTPPVLKSSGACTPRRRRHAAHAGWAACAPRRMHIVLLVTRRGKRVGARRQHLGGAVRNRGAGVEKARDGGEALGEEAPCPKESRGERWLSHHVLGRGAGGGRHLRLELEGADAKVADLGHPRLGHQHVARLRIGSARASGRRRAWRARPR